MNLYAWMFARSVAVCAAIVPVLGGCPGPEADSALSIFSRAPSDAFDSTVVFGDRADQLLVVHTPGFDPSNFFALAMFGGVPPTPDTSLYTLNLRSGERHAVLSYPASNLAGGVSSDGRWAVYPDPASGMIVALDVQTGARRELGSAGIYGPMPFAPPAPIDPAAAMTSVVGVDDGWCILHTTGAASEVAAVELASGNRVVLDPAQVDPSVGFWSFTIADDVLYFVPGMSFAVPPEGGESSTPPEEPPWENVRSSLRAYDLRTGAGRVLAADVALNATGLGVIDGRLMWAAQASLPDAETLELWQLDIATGEHSRVVQLSVPAGAWLSALGITSAGLLYQESSATGGNPEEPLSATQHQRTLLRRPSGEIVEIDANVFGPGEVPWYNNQPRLLEDLVLLRRPFTGEWSLYDANTGARSVVTMPPN